MNDKMIRKIIIEEISKKIMKENVFKGVPNLVPFRINLPEKEIKLISEGNPRAVGKYVCSQMYSFSINRNEKELLVIGVKNYWESVTKSLEYANEYRKKSLELQRKLVSLQKATENDHSPVKLAKLENIQKEMKEHQKKQPEAQAYQKDAYTKVDEFIKGILEIEPRFKNLENAQGIPITINDVVEDSFVIRKCGYYVTGLTSLNPKGLSYYNFFKPNGDPASEQGTKNCHESVTVGG